MTTQTTDRTPVENLRVGDTVRAVIDGPDGVVTDNDRMGWTVVRYEPAHPKADGIMLYKHRKDALYVIREAVQTASTPTGESDLELGRRFHRQLQDRDPTSIAAADAISEVFSDVTGHVPSEEQDLEAVGRMLRLIREATA
jgi:hypothetical protein